ncbi:response regulator transcription factor [Aestuariimicrobium kwangyangense]|uniref:response regulator transcription factor n=1 Tax=Aestuariimicrobium kwangyangense TaxID=396389 RepID=UPI0003F81B52|nr:response regulator [Aestuariimicrobium kwangyangense]
MTTQRAALVIEDDDDIRRLLEIVLQGSGFLVSTAGTGAGGLDLAGQGARYDLITVDAGLPDIDGTEVVRRLRTDERMNARHGRVVMISARSSASEQSKGLEAGADAYFTKPFRPSKLRTALEELLTEPHTEL